MGGVGLGGPGSDFHQGEPSIWLMCIAVALALIAAVA
jgi:hypothetical protein